MRVVILEDYGAISEFAAEFVCNRIKNFTSNSKNGDGLFVLGLPTGSSPLGMYKKLIEFHQQNKLSFARVKTFNMDEYVGIPQNHPDSYRSFMFKNFFQHIDIDPQNVNILDGNAKDLEAECARYEKEIYDSGGIHLFIGGLGQDGHVAFNEPGTSLNSRTHIQDLTQGTIQANARFFDGQMDKVPKKALTVGIGTIMDAKEVLIIVNGSHKAYALHKTIESGISHMWTASALQNHANTHFVVDEDSTLELKVKTVKYYKEIFQKNSQLNSSYWITN